MDDRGIGGNQTAIEIGEAKEHLELLEVNRDGPGLDSSYFDRVHANPIRRDNVTQVRHRSNRKLALSQIAKEIVSEENVKDSADVGVVGRGIVRKNDNIVVTCLRCLV